MNYGPSDIKRKLQQTFDYTKIDFLNIKNPKIIDAKGNNWNHIPVGNNKILSTRDLEKSYITTNYSDAEIADSRAELYIRYKNKDFSKFNLYGITISINKNGDANFYTRDNVITIKGYLDLDTNQIK